MSKSAATTRTYKPKHVEPEIVPHQMGKNLSIDCVTVKLSSEEWAFCDESSRDLWACQKTGGTYEKGILNTEGDPAKTTRTGILGEMAFAKIAGLVVDTTYESKGKAHDFEGPWGSIDIKTASKLQPYKSVLVYAQHGSGKEIQVTSDYYVAAYVASENRDKKLATVIIVGWCTNKELKSEGFKPAKVGHHQNFERRYDKLRNIGDLLKIIKGEDNDNSTKDKETIPGTARKRTKISK